MTIFDCIRYPGFNYEAPEYLPGLEPFYWRAQYWITTDGKPDAAKIGEQLSPARVKDGTLTMLDVEWPQTLAGGVLDVSPAKRCREALQMARRVRPNLRLGLFSMLPPMEAHLNADHRGLLSIRGSARTRRDEWEALADANAALLLPEVDWIGPDLHEVTADTASDYLCRCVRVLTHLRKRTCAPVYPFVSPMMAGTPDFGHGDSRYFAEALRVCRDLADGCVVWVSIKGSPATRETLMQSWWWRVVEAALGRA